MRNLIEMPASSTQPIVVGDMRLTLVDDCALVSVSTDAMRTAGVIELLTSMGYPLPGIEQNTAVLIRVHSGWGLINGCCGRIIGGRLGGH